MKNYSIIYLATFLFSSAPIFAQRQADTVISFNHSIQQIVLNPFNGHVLVKGTEVVSDYNPETQKTGWVVKKKDVLTVGTPENTQKLQADLEAVKGISPFLGSPYDIYFMHESPYVCAVIDNRDVLIHSITGKVALNSGAVDYRILQSHFLAETDETLLLASDGKNFYSVLWDLQAGKEKWKTEIGVVAKVLRANKEFLSQKTTTKNETILSDDAVYSSINGILYKFDKQTGKILWQTKNKKKAKIDQFYFAQSDGNIVIINNRSSSKQRVNVLSSQDGSPIWKSGIKTGNIFYLEDRNDKLFVAHTKGFNLYNYANGKKNWKRKLWKTGNGKVLRDVVPVEDGYLYIADNKLNLIDANGKKKWRKSTELTNNQKEAVYFMEAIGENKVVYLTPTHANLVDITSGKKVWKKNLEFDDDEPLLCALDDATRSLLVYNDEKLYKIDAQTAKRPKKLAKIKKIKEDEKISDIGLFDWGVSVVGEKELVGVALDGTKKYGKAKYRNAYKEPKVGKRELLKRPSTIANNAVVTASKVNQRPAVFVSKHTPNEATEDIFDKKAKQIGLSIGVTDDVLSKVNIPSAANRLRTLKTNGEYAFVLAKGPKKSKTSVLVKVKKEDGTEVDKITLDNAKHIYEIDPCNDNIYYVFKNELHTYSGK
ncbi:hypothetical protein FACS1894199_04540 [Bacteroidia bacterium]|nr:hypothetical protein FACS1894199_04540 [Bacteroidia bacterium]